MYLFFLFFNLCLSSTIDVSSSKLNQIDYTGFFEYKFQAKQRQNKRQDQIVDYKQTSQSQTQVLPSQQSIDFDFDNEIYRQILKNQNKQWIQKQNAKNNFQTQVNKFSALTTEQWSKLQLSLAIPQKIQKFEIDPVKQISVNMHLDDKGKVTTDSKQLNQIINILDQNLSKQLGIEKQITINQQQNKIQDYPTVYTNIYSKDLIDINWVRAGMVTPIRDQGYCGSCYVFSSIAAIEAAYLLKNKQQHWNLDLSQQQIIDCSSNFGNFGCKGGWIGNVYKYVNQKSIHTQKEYPYLGKSNTCLKQQGNYKISNYKGGSVGNCQSITAMLTGRPIAVAVASTSDYWKQYKSGVLDKCGDQLDHGMLLVGAFKNATEDYWILRNSLGVSWGQKGYVRLSRKGDGNTCQICTAAYYPIVS